MHIDFTGHQLEVTNAMKEHTLEKFEVLEKHFDKITSIHVVLNVEKLRQIAEGTVLVAKDKLYAKAEDEDMYAAINSLADKLNKQLIKHKEKMHAYHRD